MHRTALLILTSTWLLSSCSVQKAAAPSPDSKISSPVSAGLLGSWDQLGYQPGQPVPNFTLFNDKGKPFQLYRELKKGKPIVILSGSYTCDISRAHLPDILDLSERFGEIASFFIVFTIEAHPDDKPSPYSPDRKIWLAPANVRDNVKAHQPRTYSDRVALSAKWKKGHQIRTTVLVDSPDNFFWEHFGQAPNMAYIINPDRTVYHKQAFFGKKVMTEKLQTLQTVAP